MRILVVEDNGELVGLITKALERAGMEVDSVRTAGDGEAALRTMPYAALVLDLGLPDADGLTLLDQMRRTYPLHAPRARCARPHSPHTTARATM